MSGLHLFLSNTHTCILPVSLNPSFANIRKSFRPPLVNLRANKKPFLIFARIAQFSCSCMNCRRKWVGSRLMQPLLGRHPHLIFHTHTTKLFACKLLPAAQWEPVNRILGWMLLISWTENVRFWWCAGCACVLGVEERAIICC